MYIPYNPCKECKHKSKLCEKCEFKIAEKNYKRAIEKIRELSAELGKQITILT